MFSVLKDFLMADVLLRPSCSCDKEFSMCVIFLVKQGFLLCLAYMEL